jgi:hypothetical protein
LPTSNAPGTWGLAAPQNVSATLTPPNTSTPYITITFQNGEQRRFDGTSGMLTTIIDRNGSLAVLPQRSYILVGLVFGEQVTSSFKMCLAASV